MKLPGYSDIFTSQLQRHLLYFQDIVQFSYMPRGGHFAAFEEPQLLVEDFLNFIAKLEKRDKITFKKVTGQKLDIIPLKEKPVRDTLKEHKIEEKEQIQEAPKPKPVEMTKDEEKINKEKVTKTRTDTKKKTKSEKSADRTDKTKTTKETVKNSKTVKSTKEPTKAKKTKP